MDIPKIIHQIWWQGPLPEEYAPWSASFSSFPGWSVQLWTECDVKLLASLDEWECIVDARSLVEKVDIAKFIILAHRGGVFCDADMENQLPLDRLILDMDVVVAAVFVCPGTHQWFINNAFIASIPNHAIILNMLTHIKSTKYTFLDCIPVIRVNAHAGPLAWTTIVHTFCDSHQPHQTTLESEKRCRLRVLPPGVVDLFGPPELNCLIPWAPQQTINPHITHYAKGTWRGCCVTFIQTCSIGCIGILTHYMVSVNVNFTVTYNLKNVCSECVSRLIYCRGKLFLFLFLSSSNLFI